MIRIFRKDIYEIELTEQTLKEIMRIVKKQKESNERPSFIKIGSEYCKHLFFVNMDYENNQESVGFKKVGETFFEDPIS